MVDTQEYIKNNEAVLMDEKQEEMSLDYGGCTEVVEKRHLKYSV